MDNLRAMTSVITPDFRESLKTIPDSIICFKKLKSLPELDVSKHDFSDNDEFNNSSLLKTNGDFTIMV